jgi:hypothetical protein
LGSKANQADPNALNAALGGGERRTLVIYFTDDELNVLDSELCALLEFEAEAERDDLEIIKDIRKKINKEQVSRKRNKDNRYIVDVFKGRNRSKWDRFREER